MTLVSQGEDAIAKALRGHRVVVHLPKQATRTPRTPRQAGTGTGLKHKLNLDIARHVRARLAAGEKPQAIATDLKVHYTTIADIRDNKTWKEPGA